MLPTEKDLLAEAERTVVRRAIWSLPRWVIWVALAACLAVSYFYGGK
ncbi:MAG TPA: hypothetical protein VFV25_13480 [Methylibium sp.]